MTALEISNTQPYRRTLAFWLMVVTNMGFGGLDVILYDFKNLAPLVNLGSALTNGYLLIFWCTQDARFRSFLLTGGTKVRIFLIGLWGVPVYFWKSRSAPEFFRQACGLWLFALIVVAYYAGFC